MLQLQRASAGSGKTYTLAKIFIYLFITIKGEGGRRRLRTERELKDSLSHILAITFTVKATSEMKKRIIDRLGDLARWHRGEAQLPDYMYDFSQALGVSPAEISATCAKALSTLLHSYSTFNVNTIDSFFQTILRTFAHETQLTEGFNIELETDLVSRSGVEATLSSLKNDTGSEDEARKMQYWIRRLMEDTRYDKGWNMFDTSSVSNKGAFSQLSSFAKITKNEQYKRLRSEINTYFRNHPDYQQIFEKLEEYYDARLIEKHGELLGAVKELCEALDGVGIGMNVGRSSEFKRKVTKYLDSTPESYDKVTPFLPKSGASWYLTKNLKLTPDQYNYLEEYFLRVHQSYEKWKGGDAVMFRKYYRSQMMFLGMMQTVEKYINQYLNESDSIDISDTNEILHRIIGRSDAPFIYERLGTILRHFLIDEFQDTSFMQWENLEPLLSESLSDRNECLIIGDAKQSIYRFRNAAPGLISTQVPATYGDKIIRRGDSKADNTNHRSKRMIVEFNNTLFMHFSKLLDEEFAALKQGLVDKMTDLSTSELRALRQGVIDYSPVPYSEIYSNVVQYPKHQENKGYIEVNFVDKNEQSYDETEEEDKSVPTYYKRFPFLVADLLQRGYKKKDIAFLVRTHENGKQVIDTFIAYNNEPGRKEEEKINFISDDSLRVNSASSVRAIVAILRMLTRGEGNAPGNVRDIADAFAVYMLRQENAYTDSKAFSEAFNKFFTDYGQQTTFEEVTSNMPAVTLISLVESIISTMIPASVRQTEAAYISAFQDAIVSYCDSWSTDVGSFLQWWDVKKDKLSVETPGSADAVQVMTYHSSKGLEFPVVVIVELGTGREDEYIWSAIPLDSPEGLEFPPAIPLEIKKMSENPWHGQQYLEYKYNRALDEINTHYVAFTRAVDMLYVYAPMKFNKDGILKSDLLRTSKELYEFPKKLEEMFNIWGRTKKESLMTPEDISYSEGNGEDIFGCNYQVGEKSDKELSGNKKGKQESIETEIIEDYVSRLISGKIHCKASIEDIHNCEARKETDVMRTLLSMMRHRDMMPLALRRMKSAGLLDVDKIEEIEARLRAILERGEVAEVFDTSRYEIVTSQTLQPIDYDSRYVPDRLLLDKTGCARFIRFVFGDEPESEGEQFLRYIYDARNSGLYKDVRGEEIRIKY